jgi:hypothetical protein
VLPGTHFLWWRAVLLSHFPESQRVQKKRENFLNSTPTSTEDALRLLSAPSGKFWQQTAICLVSLWALVVDSYIRWTEHVHKLFVWLIRRIACARAQLFVGLIRRIACARAQFSGCSSTTNSHSETRQMAVCCQNLPLGALSSRSAPSVMVGELFKKFGLFLNTGVLRVPSLRRAVSTGCC